jgi:hypothetical protein
MYRTILGLCFGCLVGMAIGIAMTASLAVGYRDGTGFFLGVFCAGHLMAVGSIVGGVADIHAFLRARAGAPQEVLDYPPDKSR